MAEPTRIIEESEHGLVAALQILGALLYLVVIVPILFIFDLLGGRRGRT